ncbi:mediator of RNA polymerase II transcription subunit 8 [Kalmusia sp. IMI 367209]|nr:mediator of RNA polymerase II transcription subunit 8 [Kalmusia sp. IMI 367209]
MSQNAPGEPSRADIALLESLRARLMPLVYNLEGLKNEVYYNPNAPPDWPSIQRSIAALSSTLNSIHSLINDNPDATATLRALHAYPIPPFPITDPNLGHLPDAILRKVPTPEEKDWILAKLAKAAEFAHVPGDWDIEAKKPVEEGEDESGEGGVAKVKRSKANLDEDQLADIWNAALGIVDTQGAIFEEKQKASNASTPAESGEEDEEMEDVVGTGATSQPSGSAPAHPTAVAQPMMSLDTIHRFMSTGTVPH